MKRLSLIIQQSILCNELVFQTAVHHCVESQYCHSLIFENQLFQLFLFDFLIVFLRLPDGISITGTNSNNIKVLK